MSSPRRSHGAGDHVQTPASVVGTTILYRAIAGDGPYSANVIDVTKRGASLDVEGMELRGISVHQGTWADCPPGHCCKGEV